MEKSEAIKLINELMGDVDQLRQGRLQFDAWKRKYHAVLDGIFGPGSPQLAAMEAVNYQFYGASNIGDDTPFVRAFQNGLQDARGVLGTIAWEIEKFGIADRADLNAARTLWLVETICQNFHPVCRQLRERHDGRSTLDVSDEYDVQDLLHALLKVHFADVRSEEWTPSYAGRASRVDFLLKKEKIVIECKKTRKGLDARKVGEELIIDIARYRSHPDCRTLVCFVYDPDARLTNPAGLENDLTKDDEQFSVKVIIAPK